MKGYCLHEEEDVVEGDDDVELSFVCFVPVAEFVKEGWSIKQMTVYIKISMIYF